jgi:hypothetical protein
MLINKIPKKRNFQLNILYILIFAILVSCTPKSDLNHDVILLPLPTSTSNYSNEVNQLDIYRKNLDQIDLNKKYSSIDNDVMKKDFRNQMMIFRRTYNECTENINNNNEEQNLKYCMRKLETIWDYILKNFKI